MPTAVHKRISAIRFSRSVANCNWTTLQN